MGGITWIGEVKVTRTLSVEEAFRAALGQLLVYGATQFSEVPRMAMFLDATPREQLLRLAEGLGIAVIVETSLGQFRCQARTEDGPLTKLFETN